MTALDPELREALQDAGASLLMPPSLDAAIVGVDTRGRAVYCEDRLIAALAGTMGGDVSMASDWYNHNVLGSISGPNPPIVIVRMVS